MSPTTGHDSIDRLMPAVYDALREIASRQLAGQSGGTLTPTGLVHEAYLRMAARSPSAWRDRHFFALASLVMRQMLVDRARARLAQKRVRTVQRDWGKARMLLRRAVE